MMTTGPSLTIGQIIALNPPGIVTVAFKNMSQGPTLPVKLGFDYADGLRTRQKPMPQVGTWGLIGFPNGDVRNGIWICSIIPSMVDALTTTVSGGPNSNGTDPFIDYESHFSGHWWIRDGLGNYAVQWPDQSTLTIGYSGVPTTYRHIVNSSQNQQQIAFTQTDRIPGPPGPFGFKFTHATSGAASGQTGTTVALTSGGSVSVSGVSGQGQTGAITYNGSTLSIDASGNLLISLKAGATAQFTSGGSATDSLTLVSKLISKFNAHVHPDPGGGNTGTPVTPLVSGDVSSSLVETQG